MVHYLKIENFGPVKKEVEINFEVAEQVEEDAYEVKMPDGKRLLKLAYIYGANASGKTTILNAFEFLRGLLLNPIRDKSRELDFEPFLFLDAPYDNPSRFEISFYCEGLRYVYEIKFNKHSVLNEKVVFYQTAKPTELISRSTDSDKRLAKIQFGSKIKVPVREKDLLESNTLHNNSVLGAYAKTNVDIPLLEKLNKWFEVFLLGMITSENDLDEYTASFIGGDPLANAWINTFIHKADNQISEVNITKEDEYKYTTYQFPSETGEKKTESDTSSYINHKVEFLHKVKNNEIYTLPIIKESNGTKRYFGFSGFLYKLIHNSHFLCIDELETSLHNDLMKYLLQLFLLNAKNSQLLFTTHNISLMENQDFIRKDALWFCEKKEDGSIRLYSGSDFDSNVLRKDASISNAYKSGRLGAKPNLGSPYLIEK